MPGTTGWSILDLEEPEIENLWDRSHFEIIEGVLTEMAPAYYDGGVALLNLIDCVKDHLKKTGQGGHFSIEPDLIISERRVVKVDAVYLTPADEKRQKEANPKTAKRKSNYGRLLFPPTLAIECVSIGHEAHDKETKREWYAKFGIVNYWLLHPYERTLDCLVLNGSSYRVDQAGHFNDVLKPSLFPGLVMKLRDVWLD